MDPYKIYLQLDASEVLRSLRGVQRQRIAAFIDSLGQNPNFEGDYSEQDESGRRIEIRVIGRYAVVYWSDHPVKEVKVVSILKADRE